MSCGSHVLPCSDVVAGGNVMHFERGRVAAQTRYPRPSSNYVSTDLETSDKPHQYTKAMSWRSVHLTAQSIKCWQPQLRPAWNNVLHA